MVPEVSALTRVHAAEYAALLTGGVDRVLRQRTAPEVWSPLEYACHVRDVLLAQRERVLLARRVDAPALEPMGRDERVEHDGYNEQRPSDVARQLDDAALLFANVLDRLARPDWDRTVSYNFPQHQERPLHWLALHTLHELRHHLLDIRRQLDS
ncbi:DinB family protein [Nocardia sp. NPDC049707]|uniref:DinB family protein n=1 Tax=Nocardia sp. NPDC049707 TaxID=3154735 RepID=UPI00343437EB